MCNILLLEPSAAQVLRGLCRRPRADRDGGACACQTTLCDRGRGTWAAARAAPAGAPRIAPGGARSPHPPAGRPPDIPTFRWRTPVPDHDAQLPTSPRMLMRQRGTASKVWACYRALDGGAD